jgi:hypothetical protein
MAYGDVNSIDPDARLLDVHPSIVAVVCLQNGWDREGWEDRDLRRDVRRVNEGSAWVNREAAVEEDA